MHIWGGEVGGEKRGQERTGKEKRISPQYQAVRTQFLQHPSHKPLLILTALS